MLCVMLCESACVVVVVVVAVVLLVVVVCVWCVCVCVFGVVWIPTRLRVNIQNVPVYAGTPRTCVSTCARGAGTQGYVLNVHTEAF